MALGMAFSTLLEIFPFGGPKDLGLLDVMLRFRFSCFCRPEDGSVVARECFLEKAPESWKN